MTIKVTCRCGQSFAARPEYAGQTLACPVCRQPLTVPQPDDFGLEPLPDFSTPVSKSLAPAPIRSQSGSGLNMPMLLMLGGGGLVALIVLGVIGSYAYYAFSLVRSASSLPDSVAEIREITGQPAGDLTRETEKVFGGKNTPVTGAAPPGGGLQSFLPPATPAGMVTHTIAGEYSIAALPEFEWVDIPKKVFGDTMAVNSTGKKPGEKVGDIIMVHLEERPNASHNHRRAYLQMQHSFIHLFGQLRPVSNIKGFELPDEIPNVVNFSYDFDNAGTVGKGAGKIIFSTKRVCILSLRVMDSKDAPLMHASLNSFREF
ncbi:hypothetical protein [Anatilimnocola floriformis]|uniref:hypothetical protein n=1 Tax=Anatilimnocola floriformis TaxID=2948575 RepID=UPI0020C524FD|nr:hypothetical protein [Anatilimnocola floriformis]